MAYDNLKPVKKFGLSSYKSMLIGLLPPGIIWRNLNDTFLNLMEAFAAEFDRLETAYTNAIQETVPGLSVDLLPDWERIALLPDEQPSSSATTLQRQQTVQTKILTHYSGPSRQFFADLAASMGMFVLVEDGHAADVDTIPARVEEAVVEEYGTNDPTNIFYFAIAIITDPNTQTAKFKTLVNRLKPEHTDVVYV